MLARGSRNPLLYPLVVETILALRKYSIGLRAIWMSRDNKVIDFADEGSRDFHKNNVSLE